MASIRKTKGGKEMMPSVWKERNLNMWVAESNESRKYGNLVRVKEGML